MNSTETEAPRKDDPNNFDKAVISRHAEFKFMRNPSTWFNNKPQHNSSDTASTATDENGFRVLERKENQRMEMLKKNSSSRVWRMMLAAGIAGGCLILCFCVYSVVYSVGQSRALPNVEVKSVRYDHPTAAPRVLGRQRADRLEHHVGNQEAPILSDAVSADDGDHGEGIKPNKALIDHGGLVDLPDDVVKEIETTGWLKAEGSKEESQFELKEYSFVEGSPIPDGDEYPQDREKLSNLDLTKSQATANNREAVSSNGAHPDVETVDRTEYKRPAASNREKLAEFLQKIVMPLVSSRLRSLESHILPQNTERVSVHDELASDHDAPRRFMPLSARLLMKPLIGRPPAGSLASRGGSRPVQRGANPFFNMFKIPKRIYSSTLSERLPLQEIAREGLRPTEFLVKHHGLALPRLVGDDTPSSSGSSIGGQEEERRFPPASDFALTDRALAFQSGPNQVPASVITLPQLASGENLGKLNFSGLSQESFRINGDLQKDKEEITDVPDNVQYDDLVGDSIILPTGLISSFQYRYPNRVSGLDNLSLLTDQAHLDHLDSFGPYRSLRQSDLPPLSPYLYPDDEELIAYNPFDVIDERRDTLDTTGNLHETGRRLFSAVFDMAEPRYSGLPVFPPSEVFHSSENEIVRMNVDNSDHRDAYNSNYLANL